MKLYFSRGACSLGPRIIINELGLKADYEAVDLKTKKTESGNDFLQINPKGAVPTLVTDQNETLTEAAAILQYLAHVGKNTELLPPESDFKRYRALEALNYVATEMHKGVGVMFNTTLSAEIKENFYKPMILAKLKFLNHKLEHQKYIAGDHYTLADAYLFVTLTWLAHPKIDLDAYPKLHSYFEQLRQRPAIVKSLQEEGLIAAKA